ncbi:hypothetical protein BUE93_22125 [Chromobacterium amazonense]|uniref:Type IV pilus biogenesis protein PilP n=1 Tax=Chromobacterium amazonense TaxID=1382803 RepID=A0A2S9WYF0_9NEIS|nr:hypothetical protein [Chromobacterium amazonense]PRP68500.1 hypothetical protein BUE93_22125 [Chromobacterium amazonense]
MQNLIKPVTLGFLLVMPFASAADVDTFARLLDKQAEVMDAEMDAKLRSHKGASSAAPSNLPVFTGQGNDAKEPVVDAIWGVKGREVAEMIYKGKRIPVSMEQPYISKIDGWKLESINAMEVVLIQTRGKKVVGRKKVAFDWQKEAPLDVSNRVMPVVPAIAVGG